MIDSLAAAELSTAWQAGRQQRRLAWLAVLAVLASVFFGALALVLHVVSAVALFTWLICAAIAWRPRVGLYFGWGMILLFEAGNADQMMLPGAYFHGSFQSMVGLPGAIASPLELLLLLTFALWLVRGIAGRRMDFRGGRLGLPMLLFFGCLVFGLARGAVVGGDLNIALWESRFLFYAVVCYVLAASTIRTPRHVATLTTIALVAMGLWALEGTYRRVALIDTGLLGVISEFAYSHEVVIFLGTLLLLAIALPIFGAPNWQRLLGFAFAPSALFTLLATERRAGYIAIMVAFLALALVLLVARRRAFFLVALPIIISGAIYLPLFWTNTSMVGQPARAVRSLYEPDPRDASSNRYRELEKINVRATIEANPLLGVGFGREFYFVAALPDLSWWPFWRYEPHHNILWVWLKLGAVGFIAFWILHGGTIAYAAHFARTLRDPHARVFAVLALSGIVGTLVFCYVDLGLVSGRVTVFLGTIMGTLAVLDQLQDETNQVNGKGITCTSPRSSAREIVRI